MDKNISFEEFRKKGREKVGLGAEAETRAKRRVVVDKMKNEIVNRINQSVEDEEMKRKILDATKKLMGDDED